MKQILTITLVLCLLAFMGFTVFEPGLTEAASSSDNINVISLTVSSAISASCSDVTLLPSINLTNDAAAGTSTCTIETTSTGGYVLDISATSSNALASGVNSFTDYTTSSAPIAWSVGTNEKLFGFSLWGSDVNKTTWGNYNGGCGYGGTDFTSETNALYQGFYTTATTAYATSSPTVQGGSDTYICLVAEQGDSTNADSGSYNAVIQITATTQ